MPIAFTEFFQVSAQLVLTPVPIINLDGNGLKMEWTIDRTRSGQPDQGTIAVYNLGTAARKAIHETWKILSQSSGYIMEFSLGWQNLVERVIVGDVWKLTPALRVGEDVLTIFEMGDGIKGVRDSVQLLGTSNAEITVGVVIQAAVLKSVPPMALSIDPASLAKILSAASKLPLQKFSNYVFSGNDADIVDDLIDMINLEWKIYQGVFIVMEKGVSASSSPIATLLSAQTGLLTWEQTDDGGIQLTALANPNVKIGSQIQVIDSFGVPVGAVAHRVEKLSWTGATDGESTMQITGRKALLL
jgi:hypothetical protein